MHRARSLDATVLVESGTSQEERFMMRFTKASPIAASAAAVFAFHERADALERLQPPWQTTDIIQPPSSLEVGTEVVLRVRVGPLWRRIVATHVAYEPGEMFADRMVEGPFSAWYHEHRVTPTGDTSCVLTDDIEYELPFGFLGRWVGAKFALRQLERLFDYRHEVTRAACEGNAAHDRNHPTRSP